MKILFNYNFKASDIDDNNFEQLYSKRRRDAGFVFAYERDSVTYALRDHLGIVPLYYRFFENTVRFSTNLVDLAAADDKLNQSGLLPYLAFGTPRLASLIQGIEIVPPGAVMQINPATREHRILYQYQVQPRSTSNLTGFSELTDEFEKLFSQAIQRLIKFDTVGLYMSGGIDSALIGIYLRRAGVKINAYTSAPWGETSSEIPYAKINAEVVQPAQHIINYLETDEYQNMIEAIPSLYGIPHGTTTALGVTSLWKHTNIADEQQIFFGQNSDTMMCVVPAQYLTYYVEYMPTFIRRKLNPALKYDTMIKNYLALGRNFTDDWDALCFPPLSPRSTRVQQLSLAGLFIAHTPSDGEVLSQPAINRQIMIGDPYYDVDVVEFALGIPLRHRLALSRESKILLAFDKRLLQALAQRYLPEKVVKRKKAFTVSFERDPRTQQVADSLPYEWEGIPLNTIDLRFAGKVLSQWAKQQNSLFHEPR